MTIVQVAGNPKNDIFDMTLVYEDGRERREDEFKVRM